MTIIWDYTFDDGTHLKLINTELSVEEIWKLYNMKPYGGEWYE